jgi:hypothetical protein
MLGEFPFDEIAQTQKLQDIHSIPAGHTGALIYRCVHESGQKLVLKVATDDDSKIEISNNIYGYNALKEIGATSLVPTVVSDIATNGISYILMPDLGETVSQKAQHGTFEFDQMVDTIHDIFVETLDPDGADQAPSLAAVIDYIGFYMEQARASGMNVGDSTELLKKIDPNVISGTGSSLFLLDFTPDNIFQNTNTLSIIDPWRQPIYRGSFVPCLAQFQTLGDAIYKLDGIDRARHKFEELFAIMGKQLNLSKNSLECQILLGQSLQYTLSGFNRYADQPVNAQCILNLAEASLAIICDKLEGTNPSVS